MPDPFDDPGEPGGSINWNDLSSRLLLFTVHSVEQGITTTYGVKDAVRCDVVVLDGPGAGEQFANTLVFPGVLISQLKTKVGRQVLGRLGYGQAKAGQQPPWKLEAANDQERQLATRYQASTAPTDPWGPAAGGSSGTPAGPGNPPF